MSSSSPSSPSSQPQPPQQSTQPLRPTSHNNDNPPSSPQTSPPFTSPQDLLTYLYKDLTRLSSVASPSCVLHPADKSLPTCVGVEACQRHEEDLVRAGRGTLRMVVEGVLFGCVMGRLELGGGGEVREGFCGVWRFERETDGDGGEVRVVEHWENLTPEGGGRVKEWMGKEGSIPQPQLFLQTNPLPPLLCQQPPPLPHLRLKQPPQLKLDKLAVHRQLPPLPRRQAPQPHMLWPPPPADLDQRHAQDVGDVPRVPPLRGRDLGAELFVQGRELGRVLAVEGGEGRGLGGGYDP
ncbi:hypothetical protein QBC41DRAFT_378810 [Cercophora samala]|uniref:Uncharacterized protein n=1 Tax=Cercophora samala TaxID=330535 RepID=A0AA39Z7X0_9PEZI|nr:hypothetical protein QBC41DRAFT_378810 [Cercophora samala]